LELGDNSRVANAGHSKSSSSHYVPPSLGLAAKSGRNAKHQINTEDIDDDDEDDLDEQFAHAVDMESDKDLDLDADTPTLEKDGSLGARHSSKGASNDSDNPGVWQWLVAAICCNRNAGTGGNKTRRKHSRRSSRKHKRSRSERKDEDGSDSNDSNSTEDSWVHGRRNVPSHWSESHASAGHDGLDQAEAKRSANPKGLGSTIGMVFSPMNQRAYVH